jgi:hypothetical protein
LIDLKPFVICKETDYSIFLNVTGLHPVILTIPITGLISR